MLIPYLFIDRTRSGSEHALSSIKTCLQIGEELKAGENQKVLNTVLKPIYIIYGPTELPLDVSFHHVSKKSRLSIHSKWETNR
jgi:hypothetical protein